jgi:aldose 1-epimerase
VRAEQVFDLVLDGQAATVASRGGVVRSYRVAGRDVLAGVENPALFAFRGSLLAPWPNRVVAGSWAWHGRELRLPVNDPAAASALHGLVFGTDWAVEHVDSCSIALACELAKHEGYPFPLRLTVSYALTPAGLACALRAVNVGTEPAPVGLGVHPYIAVPGLVDDVILTIPARSLLQTDAAWQETGRRPAAEADLDLSSGRRIGDAEIDAAFTDVVPDAEGRLAARVAMPDGGVVTLWAGPTCRWWQVYTGHTLPPPDYRRSIAVEPMTCPPNAFNTGEVDVLEPGGSLQLDWGFRLS